MDPLWTRQVKLTQRMMDPLGLARVSERITSDLLPGITTTTTVARNYSLYCWAIYDSLKRVNIQSRSQFADEMVKRENAFVLGSLLHHEKDREFKSPIGVDVGRQVLENSNKVVRMDFRVSKSNPEGFYGLYYKGPLNTLGLTRRGRTFDFLTKRGKELALSFEKNIKQTEYYKKYITRKVIPINVLREYGKKACICMLKRRTRERELLRKIFLGKNLPPAVLEYSRRDTLLMVLEMIRQCDEKNVFFDDWVFRNIIFYSQFSDGRKIYRFDFSKFKDIKQRWRFFQFHEYFAYALETILHAFIKELKLREEGLTKNEFLKVVSDYKKIVEEKLSTRVKDKRMIDIINDTLMLYGCEKFGKNSSLIFDQRCTLSSKLNEENLRIEIEYLINENGNSPKLIGLSIVLLILLFIRFYHFYNSSDRAYVWFHDISAGELSLKALTDDIKHRLNDFTLEDFLRHILDLVIFYHNTVAYNKLVYGNDTFRFKEISGRYFFVRDFEPTWRNTRINGVLGILEDLGLCETSENTRSVTDDSIKILRNHGVNFAN
mgnify:CR=1 FL=1